MKLYLLILLGFFVSILCACNSSDKSTNSNSTIDSTRINSVYDSTKIESNYLGFNGDSLKSKFTEMPFNYTFRDEITVQQTTNSHFEGKEDKSEYNVDVDSPNSILIYFDHNTRKVTGVTFYLNHFNTSNVKIKHLQKLFDILNYFDPMASKFIVKNFKTIFYSEDGYEKLTPYENKDKGIQMGIDHSLFDARKEQAKSNRDLSSQEYIDVKLTFL